MRRWYLHEDLKEVARASHAKRAFKTEESANAKAPRQERDKNLQGTTREASME